jgi:pimeloyl-ACP methyl ester carboxylesterase
MMNGRRPIFDRICRAIDLPVVGPLLYGLNVNRFVIRYMAAGHVYSDRTWLHGERLREKLAVTRARGARFSSVRFVTGKLDLLVTRAEFLDLARRSKIPMLMIYGAQTPSRSRKEMEAFATVRGVQSVCLPQGKLSVHEEFHNQVTDAIEDFLAGTRWCDKRQTQHGQARSFNNVALRPGFHRRQKIVEAIYEYTP